MNKKNLTAAVALTAVASLTPISAMATPAHEPAWTSITTQSASDSYSLYDYLYYLIWGNYPPKTDPAPTSPAPTAPAPTSEPTPEPAPASAYQNRSFESFTDSNGVTSQFHVLVDDVDFSKPVGVIIRLHGDDAVNRSGKRYVNEFDNYGTTATSTLVDTAAAGTKADRNYIVLAPRAPLASDGRARWWGGGSNGSARRATNSAWVRELLEKEILAKYPNIEPAWLTWAGYSGGAEFISYELLMNNPEYVTEHAVMIGGGGPAWASTATRLERISERQRNDVELSWVVGSRDTSLSFNAVLASKRGEAYWDDVFTKTRVIELEGYGHIWHTRTRSGLPHGKIVDHALDDWDAVWPSEGDFNPTRIR